MNTKPVIKHTVKMKRNTKRLTVKQWEVNGELPCPISARYPAVPYRPWQRV
ncbi:hypothetical protein RRU94_01255 [Domibacillus sp. DTU_2020_1001157_1_SI_ALB_TIR_016]|uniref:hypothetical protein n=1 Tax=Domibacillus sp. DTU_2020_1001157_1_SI_ALB_TIR_016 TaxID=3077789 RepID=UPI0028E8A9E0|nr:hypothetical protein [Domibacillus sp. DTU_2020_1001157_1_SI_ALB_TIR_016]WNS78609.1 hypothetical protein RRU94_01255 [Domibacillus sp. DTU_2020_1001157_1_SI_ALB_TIR_016]